jgi:uncharacterized damage-inducible protein DinB
MKNEIIDQNKNILAQLQQAVEQLDNQEYCMPLTILSQSTIGMHVRHMLEFYECLLNGLQSGQVNYDARQRNYQIENSLVYTIERMQEVMHQLDDCRSNHALELAATLNPNSPDFVMQTSVHRELYYLLEHSTHHMAIIKMAYLQHFSNYTLPAHFGVASSTIQYQNSVHSNLHSA